MNYAGEFDAQSLPTWTSEWGGGTLPKPQHGSATLTSSLSALTVAMRPGGEWDTFYQLQRLPGQNVAQTVTYHLQYKFPMDADLALCQALEFEIQRNDGHRILNGGVQFDLKGTKTIRTFDFSAGNWVGTGLACDTTWLIGGTVLDVVCVYDLTPSTITWRGLQINGLWKSLGITRPAVPKVQNPYLNFAFQFDCTGRASPATLVLTAIDIVVT